MRRSNSLVYLMVVAVFLVSGIGVAHSQTDYENMKNRLKREWFALLYKKITGENAKADSTLDRNNVYEFINKELSGEMLNSQILKYGKKTACQSYVSQSFSDESELEKCLGESYSDVYGDKLVASRKLLSQEKSEIEMLRMNFENRLRSKFIENDAPSQSYKARVTRKVRVDLLEFHDADDFEKLVQFKLPVFDVSLFDVGLLPKSDALEELEEEDPPASALSSVESFLNIRRSYLNKDDTSKPAVIGFTRYGGDDETRSEDSDRNVFDVNGALTLKLLNVALDSDDGKPISFYPSENWRLSPELIAGVESQLTTDQDTSTITHFLGGEFILDNTAGAGGFLQENRVVFSLNYMTDRKYSADIYGGLVEWTPSWEYVGWGRDLLPSRNHTFFWRPYLGLTYDNVEDAGVLPNTKEESQFNFIFRTNAKLTAFDKFSLSPEIKFTQEFRGNKDEHLLYSLIGELKLDDDGHFSLTASYERGEEAPTFETKEQFMVGLGIKF